MTKRILSFLLCLVLLFHTLPLNSFATSTSQTDPEIVAVRFFNDCTSDDYITISDASETLDIHFNSTDNPYKFEIEFTDPDKVSYVFVSSTVKGNEKSLDATYDETLGAFVTSGYFDPDDKCYEPSNVRIHYTLKPTAPAVGSTVDWDEVIGCLDPDLQTATVNNTSDGLNNSGTIDFSSTKDELENVVMDYAITTFDEINSTELDSLRSYYKTEKNIISYVIPGVDDSRYYAYLDMSDPSTYIMFVDDGLSVGSKAVKLKMEFLDESSSQYWKLSDISTIFSNAGTAVGIISDTYNIKHEMNDLRDEINSADYVDDKEAALQAVDSLEADRIAFALLITAIPILVTGGVAAGPAAALFTAIIGVMAAASDSVFQYRVASIKGEAIPAKWTSDTVSGSLPGGNLWEYNKAAKVMRYRGTGRLLRNSGSLTWWQYVGQAEKIVVEEGLTSIGEGIITGDDVVEVQFPNSLTTLEEKSFTGCDSLETVTLPAGFTTVDSFAFWVCPSLKSIYFPVSLQKINNQPTNNCPYLTDIYYSGNIDQWKNIEGSGYFDTHDREGNRVYTVHCYPWDSENQEAHIHSYGLPEFAWNGVEACTATFVCVAGDDTQTLSCTVTSETTSATDHSAGQIIYTATVVFDTHVYTDTKAIDIPSTGHNSHTLLDLWHHDESQHWKQCTGCSEKFDTANHIGGIATCSTSAVCSVCGISYGEPDSTNHSGETEVRNTRTATESENGYTGDTYCIRCGNVILTGEVVPAIHVHSYTETVTPPTCNAQGFTTFTCSCSDSYVDNYVAATGHDYDNGIITKKPDCATAGVKTFICKNDSSHTYTESIPATGHSYNEIVTLPTCTEKGYTTHTCVCGDSYIDTYIDALGHTGGTATCTRKAICKNCNEYYGEFASHDYSTEWSHGNENGHWHECLHCSAHDKQVPHIPGAAATEKTAQWCTVCSYVITPALGHTCTADNQWHTNGTFHWHLCTSCGSWVNSKIHSYSDDADTSCNVCGYVRAVKIVPTTVPTEETLPVEETAVTEIPTASTVLPTFDEEEDFTSPAGNSETEDVHTTGIKTIIAVAAGIATVSSIAVLVFFLYKKRIFPR